MFLNVNSVSGFQLRNLKRQYLANKIKLPKNTAPTSKKNEMKIKFENLDPDLVSRPQFTP